MRADSSGARPGLKCTRAWAPIGMIQSCHGNVPAVCLGMNAILKSYMDTAIRLSTIKSWLYCLEVV